MRPGRKFSISTSEPLAEPPDRVESLRGLEVDRHRALVPVEREVVGGVRSHEGRPPLTRVVAFAGTLDLDHVGAQIAQDLGRERSGEHPGEVQDADTGQRKRIHGAEPTSLTRCASAQLAHRPDNQGESVCERAEPRARQCIPRRCRGAHREGGIAGSHSCGAWQGIGLPGSIVDRARSEGIGGAAPAGAGGGLVPPPGPDPGRRWRTGDDRAQRQTLPEAAGGSGRRSSWRPGVLGSGPCDRGSAGRAGSRGFPAPCPAQDVPGGSPSEQGDAGRGRAASPRPRGTRSRAGAPGRDGRVQPAGPCSHPRVPRACTPTSDCPTPRWRRSSVC